MKTNIKAAESNPPRGKKRLEKKEEYPKMDILRGF